MRLVLTLIVFVMVGSTLAGSLVTALLAGAIPGADIQQLIPWVAIGGFLAAVPISYLVANAILKKTGGFAAGKR